MPQSHLHWLEAAFPHAEAPYSLTEILDRVQAHHSPRMSRSAIHRAWKALLASRATCELARAINQDDGEKTYQFNAESARRIARRATRAKVPVSQLKK